MSLETMERLRLVFKNHFDDESLCAEFFGGAPILENDRIDSLEIVQLTTVLEKEFDCRFDIATLEETLESVNSLVEFLGGQS